MFRPFPNWPSLGWNTISEELYTYYNTIIVSVSTKGGDDIVFQPDDGQLGNGRNM